MLDILTDTVQHGVAQQEQKLHRQPAAAATRPPQRRRPQRQPQGQPQHHRRPQQQSKGQPQGRPQQPRTPQAHGDSSSQQQAQGNIPAEQQNHQSKGPPQQQQEQRWRHPELQHESFQQHLQLDDNQAQLTSGVQQQPSATRRRNQNNFQPASEVSVAGIPETVADNKIEGLRRKPKPFALPGRFVNLNRAGQNVKGISQYREKPLPHSSTLNRHKKPEFLLSRNVTYQSENPSRILRNKNRRRRPKPTTQRNKEVTNHFPAPLNRRLPFSKRRPTTFPADDVTPSGNRQHRPLADSTTLESDQHHVSISRGNSTDYFEPPPMELLNPKPNTWRGSGIDQTPSDTQPKIWKQAKYKKNWNPGTKDDDESDENNSDNNLNSGSSHAFYPATITPAQTTTSSTTPDDDVLSEGSPTSSPPGSDSINVHDVLSAIQMDTGVPIKWLPDPKLNHKMGDECKEKPTDNT